ncbi:MAG TPA: hypothetical protein VNO30_02300 [Kofleriaceae bacterium]|nr:hypothetical protein [Kofleriaceae bacterium]
MRFQLPLAVLLTVPTTIACTDNAAPPADDLDSVTEAIERENGGFDTSDEAPLFGDDALYAAADIEADAVVTDPLATDPVITDLEANTTVDARNVVVMWGRMPADPDGAVRNWSGELRLSRGAMVVRRRIAFEEATDRIPTRTRRDVIQFQSRTSVHADGFALTVFDPTPADTTPLTLTYVSADGAATYTLDLGALTAGPVAVDAGDGNQIVAIGHRRRDACEHGFLRGRWHAMAPGAGHYAGLVLSSDGEPTGHIRGIYGKRRNGESVFFGKFIARAGGFRGIIRGTYDGEEFNGRWLDRAGDRGMVHGMYRSGDTLRAGAFLGRWAETSCATDRP